MTSESLQETIFGVTQTDTHFSLLNFAHVNIAVALKLFHATPTICVLIDEREPSVVPATMDTNRALLATIVYPKVNNAV